MVSNAIRISLLPDTCSILLWFHELDDGGRTAVSFRQNRQHGGKEAVEVVIDRFETDHHIPPTEPSAYSVPPCLRVLLARSLHCRLEITVVLD